MGSVFNRGTRAKPKWYGKYKDADEKWKTVATKQPTKTLAKRYIDQIEGRIADGMVGIERPSEEPKIAELMERWLAGLTNRNAADDRKRCENHVLPVFGHLSRSICQSRPRLPKNRSPQPFPTSTELGGT